MGNLTTLERAFQLADQGISGQELRETLRREGYDRTYLNSPSVKAQLMKKAKAAKGALLNAGVPAVGAKS